jgi:hypothetical protein
MEKDKNQKIINLHIRKLEILYAEEEESIAYLQNPNPQTRETPNQENQKHKKINKNYTEQEPPQKKSKIIYLMNQKPKM